MAESNRRRTLGLKVELLYIIDRRASYYIYATSSLEDLTLEYRLAFFLELLQCQNVNYIT